MSSVHVHCRQRYSVEFDDGKSFELSSLEPYEDSIIRWDASDGKTLLGYLVNDPYCENPLESADGIGRIFDGRQSASPEHVQAYRKAIGWGDGEPNPDAVLLDVYAHSGEAYAVSGSLRAAMFPDQDWDVCHGGAVWVPDEEAICSAECHAAAELLPSGSEIRVRWAGGRRFFEVKLPDGKIYSGYSTPENAAKCVLRRLGQRFDKNKFQAARRRFLEEIAQEAADALTEWSLGDCWGAVVELFDAEGRQLDEDSCYGFIGYEYAEQRLKEMIEAAKQSCLEKDPSVSWVEY